MTPGLERIDEILRRTPGVLRALLAGLPAKTVGRPEREGAWSPRDVVAHLADLERDGWIPRIRTLLDHGEERILPGIERERFRTRLAGRSLKSILDEFGTLRASNLEELRRLRPTPDRLTATGRHPAFGQVTLSQLLHSWAAHDLTHLAQVTRGLAAPFAVAVGPWREYLRVLGPPS